MARTLPAPTSLATTHRHYHRRVEVMDVDGLWRDLTAYLVNWQFGATVDDPVESGSFTFARTGPAGSLMPFVSASTLNRTAANEYAPLLNVTSRIRLWMAIVPWGQAVVATDWFLGFLGQITAVQTSEAATTITCNVVDTGGYLQDRQITERRVYGSAGGTAVEVVMQQIITDHPSKVAPVTLVTPTSPGWFIREYSQQPTNVMAALVERAMQIGWDVRMAWTGPEAQALLFREPFRSKTVSDFTLAPGHYEAVPKTEISKAGIRNDISLWYFDAALGSYQQARYVDTASIAAYGNHAMQIAEDRASNITTSTEATAMVTAAGRDLASPWAFDDIRTLYFPWAELFDLFTVQANGVHYDSDQQRAVVGYRHEDPGGGKVPRTTLITRGKVAGAYARWLSRAGTGAAPVVVRQGTPMPKFLQMYGEASAYGGNSSDGSIWVIAEFEPNTEEIILASTRSPVLPVPNPDASTNAQAYPLTRQEGKVPSSATWRVRVRIATEPGWWRLVQGFGRRGSARGFTWAPAPIQAVDVDPAVVLTGFTTFTVTRAPGKNRLDWTLAGGNVLNGRVGQIWIARNNVIIDAVAMDQTWYEDQDILNETNYTYSAFQWCDGMSGPKAGQIVSPTPTAPTEPAPLPEPTKPPPPPPATIDPANAPVITAVYVDEGTLVQSLLFEYSCQDPSLETLWLQRYEYANGAWVWVDRASSTQKPTGSVRFFDAQSPGQFRLRSADVGGATLQVSDVYDWPGITLVNDPISRQPVDMI